MKVAIVHDFLNQYGGAERLVEAIKEIFPEAPVYTTIFEPDNLPERMAQWKVITPRSKKLPFFNRLIKYYTFLLPFVFESFDLRDYDVIISSTANFAKGVLTRADQLHVCYCHTPPRFLYHYETEVSRREKLIYKPILIFLDHYFRLWDYLVAQRVDYFVTNSCNTSKRISKFYRRNSEVIYPPINIKQEKTSEKPEDEGYFLVVSRLARYKRIDLAIEACNLLKKQLVIVGTGREEKRLKAIAGPTIRFLGGIDDIELANVYKRSTAIIFPGEDDFGMVPVEAMSYGKSVIAYGKGGALESVIPGKTGIFFFEQKARSLAEVLKEFNPGSYSSKDCFDQAAKFRKEIFQEKMRSFIKKMWKEKNARTT